MRRMVLSLAFALSACAHPPTAGEPRATPLLAEGDHTVNAGGLALAYHVHGRGPYCIVHPGGPGLDWSYDRMPPLEAHLTVIYLEPVGSGASAKLASAAEYTLDRYVEALEGFRAALGLDRVWLLGHSHGGFVAQLYAIAHQDHLAGLILYDTAARLDADLAAASTAHAREFFGAKPWFAEALAALAAEDAAKSDEELTAILDRELPLYFADFDGHADAYRKVFAGVRAAAAPIHAMNAPSFHFDTRADLPGLRVPTLIIVGRRDFITAVSFAEEMHAAIPGSKLVVLEHSGHMAAVEEPDAFAAAVTDFVAGH